MWSVSKNLLLLSKSSSEFVEIYITLRKQSLRTPLLWYYNLYALMIQVSPAQRPRCLRSNVFARSNIGMVGLNLTRGMCVYPPFFCVHVLAAGLVPPCKESYRLPIRDISR